MTAHDGDGIRWRHTSVLIRADIFAEAQERRLNISHECNSALADLTGIDYRQQQLPEETPAEPVIIAPEHKTARGVSVPGTEKKPLRPVLNADDPKTPLQVIAQKTDPIVYNPPPESREKDLKKPQAGVSGTTQPAEPLRSQKKARPGATEKKGGKEHAIRRFMIAKVVRADEGSSDGNVVSKDEMYQRFVRWCRASSISPIPDKRSFTVALKNKFAVQDSTVNNVSCWINVVMK
jgi:hypothetical protein